MPPATDDPLADQVRRLDQDRYLCAMFAPPARRPALLAVLAFYLEIARIREAVSEAMLGRIRLQWWRDAVAAMNSGPPSRHDLMAALAEAVPGDMRHHLGRMIEAREADFDENPFADLASLETYAADSGGAVAVLTLAALDVGEGASHEAARHVGIAWALVGLVRAAAFHARGRRLYFPADLVAESGLDVEDYFALRATPALAAVAESLVASARGHLAKARALHGQVPRRALPALLPAVLADAYMGRLRRAAFNPFDPRLAIGPLARRLILVGHAARGRY